jgi:hypothetical protein
MPERKNSIINKIKELFKESPHLTKEEIRQGLSKKFGLSLDNKKLDPVLWKSTNQTHKLVKFEQDEIIYYRLSKRIMKNLPKYCNPSMFDGFAF